MSDVNTEPMLTIALTKGRILKETLPLFAAAGLEPLEDISKSRKLIFPSNQPNVQFIVLRGSDVPTYIIRGAADIGVSGKDMLLESGADSVYELLDLNISKCRLMTAAMVGKEMPTARVRVASKFTNIAKRYCADRGIQADVIKLYGAMELAPVLDLADMIVDIVDTGNTLRANGLEPIELIANVSSRLVVNKASFKRKQALIQPLVERLAQAVKEAE